MKLKAIFLSSLLALSSALACECPSCDVDDVRSNLESAQRNRENDVQSLQSDIESREDKVRSLRSDFDDLEAQLNRYGSRY